MNNNLSFDDFEYYVLPHLKNWTTYADCQNYVSSGYNDFFIFAHNYFTLPISIDILYKQKLIELISRKMYKKYIQLNP